MSIRAEVKGVSVRLGAVQALDSIDLSIDPGQFLALLGPSGSGKTTALNVVAGFLRPDKGVVTFDGAEMTAVPPHRRDIGMVFQRYALFPHMTVAENVAFPLRMRKASREERRRKVREALDLVGLETQADRAVTTLSGGQQQRVAVARAVVFEPRMMLLDEPLAALDKQLRDSMQLELKQLQRRVGITTVAVTHDQVEALTMADVVAVLREGHVEQVGTPRELYLRPATIFVATFLGEVNMLPVERGQLAGFGRIDDGGSGRAVIRPEHLTMKDSAALDAGELGVPARVEDVVFQGPRLRARVRLASAPEIALTVAQPSGEERAGLEAGSDIHLALDCRLVHVIRDAGELAASDLPKNPSSQDADRGLSSATFERSARD